MTKGKGYGPGVQGVSSGLHGEILPFRDPQQLLAKHKGMAPLKAKQRALIEEQRYLQQCLSDCKGKEGMKGARAKLLVRDKEIALELTRLKTDLTEMRNAKHRKIIEDNAMLPEIKKKLADIKEQVFDLLDLIDMALNGEE